MVDIKKKMYRVDSQCEEFGDLEDPERLVLWSKWRGAVKAPFDRQIENAREQH